MKNKETGEFELVVGNGQIISGFFILVLLLAVFFAMGFIVARAKYQQEPAATDNRIEHAAGVAAAARGRAASGPTSGRYEERFARRRRHQASARFAAARTPSRDGSGTSPCSGGIDARNILAGDRDKGSRRRARHATDA